MTGNLFDDLPVSPETERKSSHKERPVKPPRPDPVADALIAGGFASSSFVLDMNGTLTTPHDVDYPYPWNLPSRLFNFPIEVTRQFEDGSRGIGLMHPLLADHPFVQRVEKTMGAALGREPLANEYGYSKSFSGSWWHAVDLLSRRLLPELLDTERFTTPEDIAGAVSYGLEFSPHEGKKRNGYISTTEARQLMKAIGAPAPDDTTATIETNFARPSVCKSEGGSDRWPINARTGYGYGTAWGLILGIETGWFAHDRAGFLGWTIAGRNRFPPEPRITQPLPREESPKTPPTPTAAISELADEIAARPASREQLGLF